MGDLSSVFAKKVGDFLKQGSGSLVKSGLKIPRSYLIKKEETNDTEKQKGLAFFEKGLWYHRTLWYHEENLVRYGKKAGLKQKPEKANLKNRKEI